MERNMSDLQCEMTQKRTPLPCYSEESGRRGMKTAQRARACVLASNISFMHNGMMGHRPCNFVLLGAKATVFGSIVIMAMLFPPFSTVFRPFSSRFRAVFNPIRIVFEPFYMVLTPFFHFFGAVVIARSFSSIVAVVAADVVADVAVGRFS